MNGPAAVGPGPLRVIGLCVLAFLLMFTYSIARPAAESLFLAAHTSRALPLAWLIVAVGVTVVVALYNRFVRRSDLVRLYGAAAVASAGLLCLLLLAVRGGLPGAFYALYAWKDIYIVVLVEIYYTFANSVFPIRTARWVYGLFGAVGSVGGILGNLAVGVLARQHGTLASLGWVVPLLLLSAAFCVPFARRAGFRGEEAPAATPGVADALRVVRGSNYLLIVMALVALVQIVVTLVDYEFNAVVERAFPATDYRTGVIGQVYAAVSFLTVLLHALTGPTLRLIGVPITLIGIPCLLGGGLVVLELLPRFATAAFLKVTSKCFDYTLFRAAKEILYIPLGHAEKTAGKSIVDMWTYRIAKAGASLLLLALIGLEATRYVSGLTLALALAWLLLTGVVVVRFRRKVSRAQEMASAD